VGRLLLILALLALLVAILAGVIYVTSIGDNINVTIDKSKLKATTQEAVEKGREGLHEAGEALERAGGKLQRENPDPDRDAIADPNPVQMP
jgi:hypothetical protein